MRKCLEQCCSIKDTGQYSYKNCCYRHHANYESNELSFLIQNLVSSVLQFDNCNLVWKYVWLVWTFLKTSRRWHQNVFNACSWNIYVISNFMPQFRLIEQGKDYGSTLKTAELQYCSKICPKCSTCKKYKRCVKSPNLSTDSFKSSWKHPKMRTRNNKIFVDLSVWPNIRSKGPHVHSEFKE